MKYWEWSKVTSEHSVILCVCFVSGFKRDIPRFRPYLLLLPLNSVHFAYQLKVSDALNFFFFLLISATGEKSVRVWWNASWLHNKCKHIVLPSEGCGK